MYIYTYIYIYVYTLVYIYYNLQKKNISIKNYRGWSPRNTTSRKTTPIENLIRGTLPRIAFFGLADDVFYLHFSVLLAERAVERARGMSPRSTL